jgi:hypothetical protein
MQVQLHSGSVIGLDGDTGATCQVTAGVMLVVYGISVQGQ